MPLPLDLLFHRLAAAGFALDTARRLRLLRALERHDGDFDALKYQLAPFIARNAEEQRRFYDLFAAFAAEAAAEAQRLNEAPPPEPVPAPPPPAPARRWRLALALAVGALLAALPWLLPYLVPPQPPRVEIDKATPAIAREGQPVAGANDKTKNQQIHAGIIVTPVKGWRAGLEWARVKTTYVLAASGERTTDQLALSTAVTF